MKILVKTYKSAGAYKRAVRGKARWGWRVVGTTSEQKRGLSGLLFWPLGAKTTFVVTCQKD